MLSQKAVAALANEASSFPVIPGTKSGGE